MKKIAVFGKPGSGKSVLSKKLAKVTGIPLYPLDLIVYKSNGEQVERKTYDQQHKDILSKQCWIIDGFGPIDSFCRRLEAADVLVYIDLPYWLSYWLVTKRLLTGLIMKPAGWPEGSSIIKGSIASYKTLKLCPKFWNDDFMKKLEALSSDKSLHIIHSASELNYFVESYTSLHT